MGIETYTKLFPSGYVTIILKSVLQAGVTLKKKTITDREDWITRRLYGKLIQMPEFRDGPFDIALKPEIVSPLTDANTPKGELDLRVACGYGAEVYFALEAKRLRVCYPNGRMDSGSKGYIEDGMMRFVKGKYAPFMNSGAMLGYVYDGKINEARKDINQAIKKKSIKLKINSPKRLAQSAILPGHSIEETSHALKKRPFIIYHIFLPI